MSSITLVLTVTVALTVSSGGTDPSSEPAPDPDATTPTATAPLEDPLDELIATLEEPVTTITSSILDEQFDFGFLATGQDGGGFENVAAISPDGRTVLTGGDNSGIHRSIDGAAFEPRNDALPAWARKVAAIAFDPTDPDVVVAGGGFQGQQGGVLRSTDGGATWHVASEDVRFSGQNNPGVAEVPASHPRSTGALLTFAADGRLLAGSFRDGVFASDDRGSTWRPVALAGAFVRGMALDESVAPARLWVATYDRGLVAVDDPFGAPVEVPLPGGPTHAEEVVLAGGGEVLVAGGAQGVLLRDAAGAWRTLFTTQGTFTTVAASGDRFWAAATDVQRVAGARAAIVRSDDRGTTWTTLSTDEHVDPAVGGDGPTWWLEEVQPFFFPPGSGFTAAQLTVSPSDPSRVLLAGRSGVWATDDGGERWYPEVAGLAVTANDATVIDPDSGRIAVANTDYRSFVSDDDLATVRAVRVGATKGLTVALDTTTSPSSILLATGHRDRNDDGEVFRVTADVAADAAEGDPAAPVALGLAAHTGGARPLALAAGTDASGAAVVLAAVEEAGLWRLVDGVWSSVGTAAMTLPQASPDATLAWTPGGLQVWLMDRASGVWRSDDAGASWTQVWAVTSDTGRDDRTGFLAVDPDDPDRVWVSTADGLHLLVGASAGVVGDGVQVVTSATDLRPGAIAIGPDGGLWVATRGDEGVSAQLLLTCDGGRTFRTMGDDRYRGAATNVADLDLAVDGRIVITNATQGTLRSSEPVLPTLRCSVLR